MPSESRFKVASKREQNKFIYYVEREQLRRGQDDKVGLKEKGEIRKEKDENGKVNQRSTPEGAEVKGFYPPPPLRSSHLSQGDSLLAR